MSKFSLAKTFLVFLAFIALLLLSELAFVFRNKSHYLTRFYLMRALSFAQKLDIEKSLDYIEKAGRIKFEAQTKQYPDLIPLDFAQQIDLSTKKPQLSQAWLAYIQNLDSQTLSQNSIARVFYTLGLLAYKNGEADMVIPLWQTAVYLEPELSHYHVELANFYLNLGEKEKTKSSLEYCLKFKNPIQHCQDYTDNNFSKNMSEEAGFLEKELEKYYDSS